MAIANYQAYLNGLEGVYQRARFQKTSLVTVLGRNFSSWLQGGIPAAGAAPTTAVVPTSATTGSLAQRDSSGTQRLLRMIGECGFTGGGMVTVIDRLSHQGGLSGIVITAQTTNLPTAALTRKTTGKGVMAALEIYTAIGATGTTATISYTNTVPTAGQTSPAMSFGATGFNTASSAQIVPLASGDVGVTAVASVTVLATTGTAGNFGVTLFYPYVSIPVDNLPVFDVDEEALHGFGTWFPIVDTSACLQFHYVTSAALTGVVAGELDIGED